MPIFKRIGFYLIGFSIGLVFLAYFFREKRAEFCYFPNCRVLKEIKTHPLEFSENIENPPYTIEQITNTLLQDGDVDFEKSQTHTQPCKTYVISGEIEQRKLTISVEYCGESSKIIKIE